MVLFERKIFRQSCNRLEEKLHGLRLLSLLFIVIIIIFFIKEKIYKVFFDFLRIIS